MKKTFEEMINAGELTNAARLMAKEYCESGKMGHTRKVLIENLAEDVDSLEQREELKERLKTYGCFQGGKRG